MKISHLLRILHSLDLLSVGGDILETLGVVDGKHDEESLAGPHVLVPHGAVLLLARRVQDVQQTRLPVDDDLLPVAVLDGGVVLVHEVVLDQLDGEGGLAHASRAHHHKLVLSHPGVVSLSTGQTIVLRQSEKRTRIDRIDKIIHNIV